MDVEPEITEQRLGHVGLVAAILKKLNLIERIDKILPPKTRSHQISHGQAIAALILSGIGFSHNRLYLNQNFFEQFPVEKLLGKRIKPEMLTYDVLAGALDAIYKYGTSDFFMDIGFRTAIDFNLLSSELHLDSTSIPFFGKFKKQKHGNIKITHGHSKNNRPDLQQVVLSMVTGGKSGIPFWIETHSGNVSDKEIFQQVIDTSLLVSNYNDLSSQSFFF